ncbi:MAG TPA: benzoyl-CoA reductase subunit C [Bacteroidales bacterium]|jgi:benzoyl-CoA reductase subunit C|nr:benzoyl-CoA reductase subunit C [Bacteroidota bacterium]HJN06702.1 benzoyl-CoA reductase subunit C [Bacteroidales bacterium]|tara:strand:- start:2784 stop:3950 length:1167 start_codon:yes stop_codon:yes gene_type:complete
MSKLKELTNKCESLAFDLNFNAAKKWKSEKENRVLIGYMPIYFPREIIHAVEGLAVGIMGGGDRKQIIVGDAYYQSYICHIPRGIIEMALSGHFEKFDGFVFPSICDVIRNLSGMFQLSNIGKFAKYMDFPQDFNSEIGGEFYITEMNSVLSKIKEINGVELTTEALNNSITLFNKNRQLIEEIYNIRQSFPWRLSAVDTYHIVRAGMVIPVEEHNKILEEVLVEIRKDIGQQLDKIKVVVSGSFCEQPPVSLIKTIEMAGCYILDDDFMQGSRWIQGDVDDQSNNPLEALAEAYINSSTFSSSVYDVDNHKGARLINLVKMRDADGVIFAAPSFCDPALLDNPLYNIECEKENIRYINFQYHENIGQFKVIKEQVGAFSDSIKLWEA